MRMKRQKFDEVIEQKGVRILIDPKAVMYVIGSEMDFVDEKMKSGFHPSSIRTAKGECGCGESFHV